MRVKLQMSLEYDSALFVYLKCSANSTLVTLHTKTQQQQQPQACCLLDLYLTSACMGMSSIQISLAAHD